MLTENLLRLTIAGGSEWVMVVLLGLSVISLSIVVERALYFHRRRRRLDELDAELSPLLGRDKEGKVRHIVERAREPALVAAFPDRSLDREATEKVVASALGRERLRLERRLTFLGTLGNNAPFIGLFGTVLGIIRAFNDLALDAKGGSSAVMSGISEALVATAVGLFVAIPAVIAFNYFQKQVDHALSITEALAQAIIAGRPRESSEPRGGERRPASDTGA